MSAERTRPRPQLRCPWCHDDSETSAWRTCPRDQTPIHTDCLGEFGICPICREPVDEDAPALPDPTTPLEVELDRRVFRLPSLPSTWRSELIEVRRAYFNPVGRWGVAALGTLTTVGLFPLLSTAAWISVALPLLALVSWALLTSNRPHPWAWAPPWAAPARRAWAEELATLDAALLRDAEHYEALEREGEEVTREVERTDVERRTAHRETLRGQTPIEDAQRIRGIGPKLTDLLRRAGLGTLRDLLQVDPRQIKGIGPKRAALLASWAEDRRAAIERLIERGHFAGHERVDARYDRIRRNLQSRGRRLTHNADTLRQRLEAGLVRRTRLTAHPHRHWRRPR